MNIPQIVGCERNMLNDNSRFDFSSIVLSNVYYGFGHIYLIKLRNE